MVKKSGKVDMVNIPLFIGFYYIPKVVGLGISEASCQHDGPGDLIDIKDN